jgi:hypothetical protein
MSITLGDFRGSELTFTQLQILNPCQIILKNNTKILCLYCGSILTGNVASYRQEQGLQVANW